MEDLRLKVEQVELKNRLLRLVDYMNSEKYSKLSPNKKKMIENRKIAIEMYLKVLTMEVYEDIDHTNVPDFALLGLMGSMFSGNFGFNPNNNSKQELTEKDFETEPTIEQSV